jgi:hypothetical protein
MTRPLLTVAGAIGALLAFAGCPPELTGAACRISADCPSQQTCVAGHCGDPTGTGSGGNSSGGGTTGGATGGTSTGGNGGNQRIEGTVTLNGGFQKPVLNAAWIWGWDHQPGGSQDTPQALVQTDADGSFRIDSLHDGTTYYLLAQYDLDRDGMQTNSATDTLWFYPSGVTAGTDQASKVAIDVPTFGCGVISLTDTTGTYISELLANVPSVHDGHPVSTATVTANDPGPKSQVFTLTYKTATGSPDLDNKYSWTPDGGGFVSSVPALSGSYHFGVSVPQGDGYPAATCTVQHHPLGATPTALTFLPAIVTAPPPPPTSVSWVSAPNTTEDDIYMQVQGMGGTSGLMTLSCFQKTAVKSPFAIPSACTSPDAGMPFFATNLLVEVVSTRTVYQPTLTPQAVSIEGGIVSGSRVLCEGCP